MTANVATCFLGVGSAQDSGLGHAAMVVELNSGGGKPSRLLVDCGPGVLYRFLKRYQALPDAVFITHCHIDHIADLENLFFSAWLNEPRVTPQLFVPLPILVCLHQRMAGYPGALAEGGVNFWEAFHLIPVTEQFIFSGVEFRLYPARHHAPNSAFSLHLPGGFFYSGDTRPVPEIISHKVNGGELIFHDAGIRGNPSHTGLDDLQREYSSAQRQRMHLYHYQNEDDARVFRQQGYRPLAPGSRFEFEVFGTDRQDLEMIAGLT